MLRCCHITLSNQYDAPSYLGRAPYFGIVVSALRWATTQKRSKTAEIEMCSLLALRINSAGTRVIVPSCYSILFT